MITYQKSPSIFKDVNGKNLKFKFNEKSKMWTEKKIHRGMGITAISAISSTWKIHNCRGVVRNFSRVRPLEDGGVQIFSHTFLILVMD